MKVEVQDKDINKEDEDVKDSEDGKDPENSENSTNESGDSADTAQDKANDKALTNLERSINRFRKQSVVQDHDENGNELPFKFRSISDKIRS